MRFPLTLLTPSLLHKESFIEGYKELSNHYDQTSWTHLRQPEAHSFQKEFSAYLDQLLASQHAKSSGQIPSTVYWGMVGVVVVGRITLRHGLDSFLETIGGQVGYIVRPSWRGRGAATEMLRLLLETREAKKLPSILLTCDEDNFLSEKVILNNGGVYENTTLLTGEHKNKKRFWIHRSED